MTQTPISPPSTIAPRLNGPDLAVKRRPESPRSVLRVIGLLEAIASHPRTGLSLAALGQELDAPKSSLLNLLRALVASGHLKIERGHYTLGAQSSTLARRLLSASNPSDLAKQILKDLHVATGETAIIAVPVQDDITYVMSIEPTSTVRAHVAIGSRRPLYSSAGGRAVLAFWSGDAITDYLKRTRLVAPTLVAISQPKALRVELDRVRRQGYAITMNEAEIGLGGIAAPVFRSDGSLAGSVIVSGPTPRLETRLEEFSRLVTAAAHDLSATTLDGLG